ncbi:MAG TPA: POTRA domain-containing protein [Candidatus Sulfotelmatobacter sp.]|jgi:outer membrane protein assembly factor BamA
MRWFVLGAGMLVGAAGFAQLALQAPQAAYEGQNVSAISLIANPHRDLTPFYPLVSQKAGQPYSQEKIQASAEKLKEAGKFPKVDVTVEPEVTGLRVNFLLEPAYYIGVVKFPGAEKHFSYIRLLQVADLPDEEPYDPARIPHEEKALARFLRKEGYFEAKVRSETEIDDPHQLVNVRFVVETGKQARISAVNFEGPDAGESARLRHAVESLRARLSGGLLKPGKPYASGRIRDATNLLKRSLQKQHRLANTIKENPPRFDPKTNRVEVSFKVEVGPVVTIRTVGAKLTSLPFLEGREERKLIPIYSESAVDKDLVDEGQRNLTDYFQKKGYYDVKVETQFKQEPDQILIVYTIDRGKKRKVGRIVFHGNYRLSEKDLMAQVTVKKSHIWTHGSVSQKLLKESANNIEALYADRGYEEAKVTPQTNERESKIDVAFDIQEGAETIVQSIAISGNQHVPAGQLTAPKGFQLKAGAPFSPRKMTDDRNRISATYLNRGYLNADVKATLNKVGNDPHHVNVSYAITENQMVTIDDVAYLGQEHTRRSLIARTTRIPREAPMRRGQLLEAESRLYDLTIFDWASVGPKKPITDQTNETTLVKVHEAKRNEITYGFGFEVSHRGGNIPTGTVALPGGAGTIGLNGFQIAPSQSTFASPLGSIEFNRRNMRGLGETASASILLSRLDQKYLTTYGQPHFFGTRWDSLTSFSLERNSENPLYTAALGDASFQLEKVLKRKTNTRLQFRYDFNKTELSHLLVAGLVLPQDLNVHLSTVSATFLRDTRDKPLDAHKGMFATVNFGVTPTAFGSSANFTKLFGQYAFYKPLHGMVLANSIRLGLASPFSGSFVPTSQLFFSGGGTTLRGFPIDEAGPQRLVPFCNVLQGQSGCVDVTVPVGGKQLFILNSEARFPLGIAKPIGGVFFYDGGNVYSAINFNNFVNNYSSTIGVGLRYSTPIGPVRFDIGRLLNPVPGIDPWQYYITIGQAF